MRRKDGHDALGEASKKYLYHQTVCMALRFYHRISAVSNTDYNNIIKSIAIIPDDDYRVTST